MPAGSGGVSSSGGAHAPSPASWLIDWGRSDSTHNDDVRALHKYLQMGVDSLLKELPLNGSAWGTAPDGTKYKAYAQENNGSGLSLNIRETLDDVSALFGCLQCFQNVDNSKAAAAQTQPWSPTKPPLPQPSQSAFLFMQSDLNFIVEYCSFIVLELQNKPNDKGVAQSDHFATYPPQWWKNTFTYYDNNGASYQLPATLPIARDATPPGTPQGCYLYCIGYLYLFCGEMLKKQWSGSKPNDPPDISKAPNSVDSCMDLMKTMTGWIQQYIPQLTWQIPT